MLVSIAVGGCATSNIKAEKNKSLKLGSSEKIVVVSLGNRADDIADCVQKNFKRVCPDLQFFPPEEFADRLYPWFEPGTAPENKEDLQVLYNNRLVRERIERLGVRYVVNISGRTLKSNYYEASSDDLFYGSIEQQTDIFVSVCDLKEAELILKTESHSHDIQYLFLIGILPIWIPASTEAQVCDEIVKKLALQLPGCDPTVGMEKK